MRIVQTLFLVCTLFFFTHCRPLHSLRSVSITRSTHMHLLAPHRLGYTLQASQIFRFYHAGKKRTMYVQLEVDTQRIVLVGLTPVGAKLFVLSFSEKGRLLYQPQPFFKVPIQPAHVLADFQLTYWPVQELRKALHKKGMNVLETTTSTSKTRVFTKSGKECIRIQYTHPTQPWKSSVRFKHQERNYRYTIKTMQARIHTSKLLAPK